MTRFWDKVFDLILSKGQREKHEKYMWDRKYSDFYSPISVPTRPSLDKPALPELKPTVPPPTVTSKGDSPDASPKSSSSSSPSTTPRSQWSSPHPSRSNSPAPITGGAKVPRAPLPRRPREDRAYVTLDLLMAAAIDARNGEQGLEHCHPATTATSPSTSPSKHGRVNTQPALLYEVPPLSQMQGIGRYRRSVNATDDFMDSKRSRDDSYANLLTAAEKDQKRASGEWGKPGRSGNMDTTSPPPPRSAFCSRANSPVRLEYRKEYGDDDVLGEEELAEVDGRLIFCRRKSKGSTNNNGNIPVDLGSRAGTGDSQVMVTTSDEGGMTTARIVAAVAQEKAAANGGAFAKRKAPPYGELGRAKKKNQETTRGGLSRALKGDRVKIEHVEDLEEAAIETDDEDVEEVESFSETKGEKLMMARVTKTEKERVTRGPDPVKRGRRPLKGPGQAGGIGGGMNVGARVGGRGRGLAGKAPGGKRALQS